MPNSDYLIYAAHGAFWGAFGLTRMVTRGSTGIHGEHAADSSTAQREVTAPFSRTLIGIHAFAFGALYLGLGNAIVPNRVPSWFGGQRVVGVLVIALGAAVVSWAAAVFNSWRFRAKLDAGHQLATGGPFRFVRHPIYLGMNLFALGTAIWVPTPIVWIGFLLMVAGSVLRARSEEALLVRAFGDRYVDYCSRTRRFIPGLY